MSEKNNDNQISIHEHQAEIEKIKGLYERRFLREKNARKSAEKLLENKSLELHSRNVELEKLAAELEARVQARTEELEAEKNHALELSHAKSDFVATMSHEIRTPINGIIGILKLLEEDLADNSEQFNLVNIAQHSSQTLLHIINDILDFSKIESGKLRLENIPFNLRETLTKLIYPFEKLAYEKKIELIFKLDSQIKTQVIGDPFRLTQVLNNFLSNAFKFTEQGKIELNIQLQQDWLVFCVTDTGIGIPEDKQSRLFKDFSQVDTSTSRKYGGTGLGLVITQRIIELMGGEVGFESQEGMGSRFFMQIPYRPVENKKLHNSEHSPENSHHQTNKPLRLLLVDDNQVNRLVGQKLLSRLGHHVDCAEDGFSAIDIMKSQNTFYDLIFMDIQMPDLNGYETTQILRKENIQIPIIALTANTSNEDRQMAKESGMDDFLSKPFQLKDIENLLNEKYPHNLNS